MIDTDPSLSGSKLGEPLGVFREGDMLVVNTVAHRFPTRCVADNSSDDVICVDVHRPMIDRDTGWFLLTMVSIAALFTVGRATFVTQLAQRPPVNISISRQRFESWQSVKWTGWLICFFGGLLMIGSVAGYIACMAMNKMAIGDWAVLPLFPLGIVLAIGGAIYLSLYHTPPVKLEKTEWKSRMV